ncbi:MAG: FAD:protein FMN transferase [Lachnospiraceae bacterium]
MELLQKTFFALGTVNTVELPVTGISSQSAHALLEQIKEEVERMDDRWSLFKHDSEVSRINQLAGKEPCPISHDTYEIIQTSLELSKRYKGAFDITSQPLSQLWRIGRQSTALPSKTAVRNTLHLVNYKDIILHSHPLSAGLKKRGQGIDFGGIAKGFAADRARTILLEHGITHAVLNFGGTVITLGERKNVGIQSPYSTTGHAIGYLAVKNKAVVTSGIYERYFVKDKQIYHHIMDTTSGHPSKSGLISVTVLGDSAIELDVLAKVLLLGGLSNARKLIHRQKVEAVLIQEDGKLYMTPEIAHSFQKTKENKEILYGA